MSKSKGSPITVGRIKDKNAPNKWEHALNEGLKQKAPLSVGRIFASKAGLCRRQTATVAMIDETEMEERTARTAFYFVIGSVFEDVIKRGVDNSGIYLADEVRVEAPWAEVPISGRIDFVLKDPNDLTGNPLITEIKTCGKLPDRPKPDHLAQLKMYLCICGMDKGLLWYFSRNVAGFDGKLMQRCFEITMTTEDKIETMKTFIGGSVYNSKGIIPEIPPEMKKYKCGFCPLKNYCWDDGEMKISGRPVRTEEIGEIDDEIMALVEQAIADQDELKKSFIKGIREMAWE